MAKDNTGPLSIANEMRQFDRKNRGFYDSLTVLALYSDEVD